MMKVKGSQLWSVLQFHFFLFFSFQSFGFCFMLDTFLSYREVSGRLSFEQRLDCWVFALIVWRGMEVGPT